MNFNMKFRLLSLISVVCLYLGTGKAEGRFFISGKGVVMAYDAYNGTQLWERKIIDKLAEKITKQPIKTKEEFENKIREILTEEEANKYTPITGKREKWHFTRAYGCGTISASGNCMFFRSGVIGIYDLLSDIGTSNWGGIRPGCWINIIWSVESRF